MSKTEGFQVLVVEDEYYSAQAVKRMLHECDSTFQVVWEAENGKEALDYLTSHKVHLVITDLHMPVMNGLELAKYLQEKEPQLPVIMLTGYSDFAYIQEALRSKVLDYLLKPVKKEEMESALARVRLQLEALGITPENSREETEVHESAQMGAEELTHYAAGYIREHFQEEIDLGSLAQQLGFHSAYLTKLFNKYIGESPLRYLTGIRIQEAKRLLEETAYPISRIGEMVGYPNQFHFSKTFRRETGINPTAYRRERELEKNK